MDLVGGARGEGGGRRAWQCDHPFRGRKEEDCNQLIDNFAPRHYVIWNAKKELDPTHVVGKTLNDDNPS